MYNINMHNIFFMPNESNMDNISDVPLHHIHCRKLMCDAAFGTKTNFRSKLKYKML